MQSDIFKYVIQTLKKNLSTANELEFSIVDTNTFKLKSELLYTLKLLLSLSILKS